MKKTVGVSLDKREIEILAAISQRSGRTYSNIIRFIVKRYFEQIDDSLILCIPSHDRMDLVKTLFVTQSQDPGAGAAG